MGSGRPGHSVGARVGRRRPLERVLLELDATLIGAHSEREGPAGNFKGTYAFHRCPPTSTRPGEALAAQLRSFNAGANTAAHDVPGVELTLEQSPRDGCGFGADQARTDSAEATHELTGELPRRRHQLLDRLRADRAGAPGDPRARRNGSAPGDPPGRRGSQGRLGRRVHGPPVSHGRPDGARMMVRGERPHPVYFTD